MRKQAKLVQKKKKPKNSLLFSTILNNKKRAIQHGYSFKSRSNIEMWQEREYIFVSPHAECLILLN